MDKVKKEKDIFFFLTRLIYYSCTFQHSNFFLFVLVSLSRTKRVSYLVFSLLIAHRLLLFRTMHSGAKEDRSVPFDSYASHKERMRENNKKWARGRFGSTMRII